MCSFYYPDGTRLEGEENFVKFYSEAYYFVNRSKHYEKDIASLLTKNTELTRKDLTTILLWKSGGEIEGKLIKRPRTSKDRYIVIGDVEDAIGKYKDEYDLKEFTDETALKFIQNVKEKAHGIGVVYAITLLYFLSHGKYPIYDRFADMAVYAISNNIDPSKVIVYKEPGINAKTFYETRYLPNYVNYIKKYFKKYTNRNIDRALWTYGHLFSDNKDKTEKVKMIW